MTNSNEKQIVMTASAHDGEDEGMTPEQAAALEWWKVPENRDYMMQAMRTAAEAACAAVRAMCRMISAAADLVRELCTDETEGGVQHDRIE